MEKKYLLFSIAGFILPNIWVAKVSLETGNLLFWAHPGATLKGMFANDIATAFVIDLLFVVLVFFIWSYYEAKRYHIKNVWKIWILTMLFGLAGAFPLFLHLRSQKRKKVAHSGTPQ